MSVRGRSRSLSVPLRLLERGQLMWSTKVQASALADSGGGDELRIADVEVPLDGEVNVGLSLEIISGGVSAVGHVTAGWRGPCARCWMPLEGEAHASVSEVFAATPREGEQYLLHPTHVDLVPMVREAILLELPIEAIRCPHLDPCPNIGAEFTAAQDEPAHEEHEETAEPTDPRWAPLQALRSDSADHH